LDFSGFFSSPTVDDDDTDSVDVVGVAVVDVVDGDVASTPLSPAISSAAFVSFLPAFNLAFGGYSHHIHSISVIFF
jgi:hypothetical protein